MIAPKKPLRLTRKEGPEDPDSPSAESDAVDRAAAAPSPTKPKAEAKAEPHPPSQDSPVPAADTPPPSPTPRSRRRPRRLLRKTEPGAAPRRPTRREDQGIRARIEALPALPMVLRDTLAATSDPNATASDVARIVRRDPVVSARVMKLASSPLFMRSRRFTRLKDAVSALGMFPLRAVVAAATASQYLFMPMVNLGYESTGLWNHSVATARLSSLIAQDLALPEFRGEDFFLAGLMHDIGQLVLADMYPRTPEEVRDAFEDGGPAGERELTGYTHGEAGALLAKTWQLPPLVGRVCAEHHATENVDSAVGVVQLADAFAAEGGYGIIHLDLHDTRPVEEVARALGLGPAEVRFFRELAVRERGAIGELCRGLQP